MNWGNFGDHILKVSSVQSIYIFCVQNFILKNTIFRSIKTYFENHSRIFSRIFTLSIFKQILRDEIEKGVVVCRIGNCFFKYVRGVKNFWKGGKKLVSVSKYHYSQKRHHHQIQISHNPFSVRNRSIWDETSPLQQKFFTPPKSFLPDTCMWV